MKTITTPAAQSGTFLIAGDIPVHRLGFGAMRITGKDIWGEPADRNECIAVLRRAIELGITFIDTADSYGPFVSERLIAEALRPYPANLLIATKAGLQRHGPDQWEPDGRPEYLRERREGSLERLKVDRIDLFQLHRIDSKVPLEDQIGALLDLRREGKIRHIGLSEVNVKEIENKTSTTFRTVIPRRFSTIAPARTSASFRGFHSRPAVWQTPTARSRMPRESLMQGRARLLSRGS